MKREICPGSNLFSSGPYTAEQRQQGRRVICHHCGKDLAAKFFVIGKLPGFPKGTGKYEAFVPPHAEKKAPHKWE